MMHDRFVWQSGDVEIISKKFDPNQPRDEDGKWTDTGASSNRPEKGVTPLGDEDGTQAPKPGESFVVFRVGSGSGLEDRNAGNANGVALHLARSQSDEGPRNVGGVGATITAYEVKVTSDFTAYSTRNVGRSGNREEQTKQVGRSVSKDHVAYSFPKGGDWEAVAVASIPLADVMASMAVDGYTSFDDTGSRKGAHYIRAAFTPKLAKKGDFEGHPFRGNQYSDGWTAGMDPPAAHERDLIKELKDKQKAWQKKYGHLNGVRWDGAEETANAKYVKVDPKRAADLIGRYGGMGKFVATQGVPMKIPAKPPAIPIGVPKQCFKNASLMALAEPDKYDYAEGLFTSPMVGLLIHHGWLVDKVTNEVVDPTLGWRPKAYYHGVRMDAAFVEKKMMETKVYGTFFGPHEMPTDFLMGKDKDFNYRTPAS